MFFKKIFISYTLLLGASINATVVSLSNNDTQPHALSFFGKQGTKKIAYLGPSTHQQLNVPFTAQKIQWTQNVTVTIQPSRADEYPMDITFLSIVEAPLSTQPQQIAFANNSVAVNGTSTGGSFAYNLSPNDQEARAKLFIQEAKALTPNFR